MGAKIKTLYDQNKKQSIIIIGGIFLLAMMVIVTCAFNGSKDIKIIVDSKTVEAAQDADPIEVTAGLHSSVQEVLEDENIPCDEDYEVNVDLAESIQNIDEPIIVTKKIEGTITVDGTEVAYDSASDTIGDLLAEESITFDDDDLIEPGIDTPLTIEVTAIKIVRVETKEETTEADVPFETENKDNPDLDKGTEQVVTEGVNGKKDVVEKVTYQDGVETKRETVSETTTLEPVTQVVEVGTKEAVVATTSTSSGSSAATTTGNTTQSATSDFDLICAIVAHEGGTSYEGALGVISCVMNRVDAGYASTAVGVLTAPGQFSSYLGGYYQQYMGAAIPEVRQAVTDCMEGGVRSHPYCSFRSYQTTGSVNICGNWYF